MCFIIPGLADDETGDGKYAFLLISYYCSLWLAEGAYLLNLNWGIVVLFPLLVLLIHWFILLGGCCAKEGKLLSLWLCIVVMTIGYTLLAIPLVHQERTEKTWVALPITIVSGI